ncbi:hypothetical protein KPL37_17125 [Clostridium frigoris]|uniref:Uncharacterized protein n=1 Tax=Clostridium frigoris TaxID=205327 RepID=A0ABS6BXV7_9CLOT|nr:hypothetical protein [Clostridium frigoris]MBU3161431.1 hypothetical protein [Clostridium frigoris]
MNFEVDNQMVNKEPIVQVGSIEPSNMIISYEFDLLVESSGLSSREHYILPYIENTNINDYIESLAIDTAKQLDKKANEIGNIKE